MGDGGVLATNTACGVRGGHSQRTLMHGRRSPPTGPSTAEPCEQVGKRSGKDSSCWRSPMRCNNASDIAEAKSPRGAISIVTGGADCHTKGLVHSGSRWQGGASNQPQGGDHTLGGNVGKSGGVWEVTSQRHRPATRAAPPWPAAPPTVNRLKSAAVTSPVIDEQSIAPAELQSHSAAAQLRPPKAPPPSAATENKRTAAAICSLLGNAPPSTPRAHKRSRAPGRLGALSISSHSSSRHQRSYSASHLQPPTNPSVSSRPPEGCEFG
jgi:hypothetical protein